MSKRKLSSEPECSPMLKKSCAPTEASTDETCRFNCGKCEKSFKTKQSLQKHDESIHIGIRYKCPICSALIRRVEFLKLHLQKKHKKISQFQCLYCSEQFLCKDDACKLDHLNQCCCVKPDQQTSEETGVPSDDNEINEIPFVPRIELDPAEATEEMLESIPEHLRTLFLKYWSIIRTNKSVVDIIDHEYNFRYSAGKIDDMLSDIFEQEKSSFRINASLGAILMHKETEELTYFHASENNFTLLGRPKLIATDEDRKNIAEELKAIEKEEMVSRPDTKWILLAVVNITFFVTTNPNFIAGCNIDLLPDNITRQHNNILTVMYTKSRNKFKDNLCFFRTLAQSLTGTYHDNAFVLNLFKKYCNVKRIPHDVKDFTGTPFNDIPLIEKLFSVNIQVFGLNEKGAICWRHTAHKYDKVLNLLVCMPEANKVHYCYIRNLDALAKRYICAECGQFFRKMEKLNLHKSLHRCKQGETQHVFPGGVFKNNRTLFEELESVDINVPDYLRQCEYMAVFDFETLLKKVDIENKCEDMDSAKTQYYNFHQPVSCAVCTNVDGFEETAFFIDNNPEHLTKQFADYLEELSEVQYKILVVRYQQIFSKLDDKIKESVELVNKLKNEKTDYRREKAFITYLKSLQTKLDRYCQQLTVIGFNSKKYDLNIIKRQLYPNLVRRVRRTNNNNHGSSETSDEDTDSEENVNVNSFIDAEAKSDKDDDNDDDDVDCASDKKSRIRLTKKRLDWPRAIIHNNSYMCLTTPKLRFLDITNYLAAGSNLDGFLNMYNTAVKKAKFPYSYLDNFEKLSETKLPSRDAFFNDLKQEPISVADYHQCLQYWHEHNMTTLADYLAFYNKRDVEPFLEAVMTMSSEFWEKFSIDIFRDVISLPGLTLRYLFNKTRVSFSLFHKRDKQIYYKLKKSMLGGLSCVMTRYAAKNETFIRNNPEKPVASVVGYDGNGLYLGAQGSSMPTGFYDVWILTRNNEFQKRSCSKRRAVEWLEMEEWTTNRKIQHQGNGSEKRIGAWRLPVDGWCQMESTVYEFYGCYWHCHNCPMGLKNKKKDHAKEAQWIKTKEEYITKKLNYKLVTIWECEWLAEREDYFIVRDYMEPKFFRKYQNIYKVSENAMRKSILDNSVFGFAEVDISTPDHLKSLYADFPPIIKKATIAREHIGNHMQQYVDATDQLKQPRCNLISSFSAKNIILMTPMIQFLVRHGLKLEKIHMFIQYDETKPFEWFRDVVTENRLKGDGYEISTDEQGKKIATMSSAGKSKASSLAADTFKLLGNTGYGKSITNKENHVDVFYCDYTKAMECNLSPYVKRIKNISVDCYEVHMYKKKINMNLPIVIGLATYSWAKIRMLSFAYDFLLKYFDKSDYQWMETDTDSAYLALSNSDLRALVKPEMREEFEKDYDNWFVNPNVAYTKRQTWLFKEEFRGTAMACLCAKTYIAVNEDNGETKMSSKGLSHKLNKKVLADYRNVLVSKQSGSGQNRGFVMREDNRMWTYLQERLGLSYLYIKRIVDDDGITTKPLDI